MINLYGNNTVSLPHKFWTNHSCKQPYYAKIFGILKKKHGHIISIVRFFFYSDIIYLSDADLRLDTRLNFQKMFY